MVSKISNKEEMLVFHKKMSQAQLLVFPNSLLVEYFNQGSGIGHVANNYFRPIPLLPKKNWFQIAAVVSSKIVTL